MLLNKTLNFKRYHGPLSLSPSHWVWLQNFLVAELTLSILQFFPACLASPELASTSHRGRLTRVWREYFGGSPARPRDLGEAVDTTREHRGSITAM